MIVDIGEFMFFSSPHDYGIQSKNIQKVNILESFKFMRYFNFFLHYFLLYVKFMFKPISIVQSCVILELAMVLAHHFIT